MALTVTQEEYESLAALAQAGATTPEAQRQVDTWLRLIEKRNNIQRYILWVQWQEADSPVPTSSFPEKWPPELRYRIQLLSRPISKADVVQVLVKKARNPVTVLVSPDPAAILGWTPLDTYFTQ